MDAGFITLKARFQSDNSCNVYSRKCLLHRPCHPSECVDIRQICQIRVRLKSLSESPRHPFVTIRESLFVLIRDSLFLPIRVSLFVPIRVSLFVLIRDSLFPPISESLFVPIRVKRNFRFFRSFRPFRNLIPSRIHCHPFSVSIRLDQFHARRQCPLEGLPVVRPCRIEVLPFRAQVLNQW